MKYSKVGFADVDSYSKTLFDLMHPEGLPCPRCNEPNGLHMFRRHLNSWIVDYRCSHCWRILNPWEGDGLERSHHPHRELSGMIPGMTEGKSTTHLVDRNRPSSAIMTRWSRREASWRAFLGTLETGHFAGLDGS